MPRAGRGHTVAAPVPQCPLLQDWYLGAWVLCVLSFDLPLRTGWSTTLINGKRPVNGYRPDHATTAILLRRWQKLIEALQVGAVGDVPGGQFK